MANEKIMILKMLEEGKITADEAARLMDASEGTKGANPGVRPFNQPNPVHPPAQHTTSGTYGSGGRSTAYNNQRASYDTRRPSEPTGSPYTGQSNNRGQAPSPGLGLDDFASDLGKKFDTFARDMEPKIQRFTETVVEKTANVADMISKSMSTPPPSRAAAPSSYSSSYSSSGSVNKNYQEKNFEMLVTPGYCELNLSGLNGDILINGYNGDKITAKVTYKPKFAAASIELMKLGDKYYLNYDEDAFEFVTVDAFVPETLFKTARIETINGKIFISTLVTDYLNVIGINAVSELRNVSAENLNVDTTNGGLSILNVIGKKGKIEAFNGPITATSLDIESLKMSSNNSTVNINIDYFRNFSQYTWVLEASNGKFVMNVPSSPELGYYVKAKTSLGNVKIGLTGMNYMVNNPSFVEAKSISFDGSPKQIRLSVETSNAPLVIN